MATLAEYLDGHGESQVDFALRAGVRQQVVSRWASGAAIPRPHFMNMLVRVTAGAVNPADFYLAYSSRKTAEVAYAGALAAGQDEDAARLTEEGAYQAALATARKAARDRDAARIRDSRGHARTAA